MLSQNKRGNLNAEQSACISGRPHELLPHLSSFKLTRSSFTQHFEILCCLQRGELQRHLEQKKREEQWWYSICIRASLLCRPVGQSTAHCSRSPDEQATCVGTRQRAEMANDHRSSCLQLCRWRRETNPDLKSQSSDYHGVLRIHRETQRW